MNVGLDWDGTVTHDPLTWYRVAASLMLAGHSVYIVTMQYESEALNKIDQQWRQLVSGVHCTRREAKRPHMEALGIKIDVWIDDNPRAVEESAVEIWGWTTPEGVTIDPAKGPEELKRIQALYAPIANSIKKKRQSAMSGHHCTRTPDCEGCKCLERILHEPGFTNLFNLGRDMKTTTQELIDLPTTGMSDEMRRWIEEHLIPWMNAHQSFSTSGPLEPHK